MKTLKDDRLKGILEGLNEEQARAVVHAGSPILIIAGAGTGKTTVITRRIAAMVAAGAEPSSILALTFTEKAALEMEERVDRLVPYGYSNVFTSTFHAFGDRLLRDHALHLGLSPDFKVLSEAETIIFLKDRLYELPLDYYRPKGNPSKYLGALMRFFGRLKDEDVTPEEFSAHVEALRENGPGEGFTKAEHDDLVRERAELSAAYGKYRELMMKAGYLDFGDLVVLALKLFRERPNVLRKVRGRFTHVLTDEFQDTNYAQFELLKLLAGDSGAITVVADDDQSIYKFRGAAVSNVLNFLDAFPTAGLVTLKRNYRSVQPILDSAYRLITHNNPDRLEVEREIDKRLVSEAPPSEAAAGVVQRHFDTLVAEADFVASTIEEGVSEGRSYRDFAVLVRARSDAEAFLTELDRRRIPYHYSGNSGLYSREEIRLIISFLKSITDFSDSLSLYHLASSPVYGLTAEDLVPLGDHARRTCRPLHYVMRSVAEGNGPRAGIEITDGGTETVRRIVGEIKRYGQMAQEEPVGRVIHAFLSESGWFSRLIEEGSERAEDEVRNIARFFELTRHMEETLEIKKAAVLVEELKVLMDAGDDPATAGPDLDSDAVQVLTVHKSKGLEFDTVFMVSLVSDRFPRRSRSDLIEVPEELIKDRLPSGDFHLQEERRLFYVGMTRARETLYLTSASDYGGVRRKKISRFITEALEGEPGETGKSPSRSVIETIGASAAEAARAEAGAKRGAIASPLSFYRIDDYLTCPLKYRFAHVLRVPLLPNPVIMYGKAVHDAIAFYLKKRLDGLPVPGTEEVFDVFKRSWRNEGFSSREHETARFEGGIEALRRFLGDGASITPKAVEKDFNFTVAGVEVRGRWDLISEEEGADWIVDFKTSEVGDPAKALKKAKESDQLKLYAYAYRESFGAGPAGCELYFVESGLKGRVEMKEKDYDRVAEKVEKVADGLGRRDFTATPGSFICGYCAYGPICPDREGP